MSDMADKKHNDIDRRINARIEPVLNTRFMITTDDEDSISSKIIEAKIRSVSVNGACLMTNVVQTDGLHISSSTTGIGRNKLKLEIDLPTVSKTITPVGEVRWYNLTPEKGEYLYDVGLSFVELSKEDREELKRFITNVKKKKADKKSPGFFRKWFSGSR